MLKHNFPVRGIALVLLGLASELGAAFASAATFNVKDYGAVGDGKANDTTAIRNAVNAANNAKGPNTVFFPAGTYLVRNLMIGATEGAGKLDADPQDLTLEGESAMKSVLKRLPTPSSPQRDRIATIQKGKNLVIQKLGFDANGIERFGGLWGYHCDGVVVRNVHCFDSRLAGGDTYDRYMIGFQLSRNVVVRDSHWEDLQLEIDKCSDVQILNNLVERARNTGSIGIWAVGNNYVAENYLIQGNTIIDPSRGNAGAIVLQLDKATLSGSVFRNIRVLDNVIVYPKEMAGPKRPVAVKVGMCDSSGKPEKTIFERIRIEGNRIYVTPGVEGLKKEFIWFHACWPDPRVSFDDCSVVNNTLYYDGEKGILSVVAKAKGRNWTEAGNQKKPYQAPPPRPQPLK